jgi:NTP pyrophosphatase (non-canonical NTP hydrolase)
MPVGKAEFAIVQAAKDKFDEYAAMDAPDLPVGSWSALQVQLARWQTKNFGHVPLEQKTLGVCEEAGELAHAVLKGIQGIRGLDARDQFLTEAGDAIADCTVYLMQVCTSLRLDFGTLLFGIATHVMERDWKADPNGGGQ